MLANFKEFQLKELLHFNLKEKEIVLVIVMYLGIDIGTSSVKVVLAGSPTKILTSSSS